MPPTVVITGASDRIGRAAAKALSRSDIEVFFVGRSLTATSKFMYHSLLGRAIRKFMLPPDKGADTLVWLTETEPGQDWTVGDHYAKRRAISTHSAANDDVLCQQMWERTTTTIGGHNV